MEQDKSDTILICMYEHRITYLSHMRTASFSLVYSYSFMSRLYSRSRCSPNWTAAMFIYVNELRITYLSPMRTASFSLAYSYSFMSRSYSRSRSSPMERCLSSSLSAENLSSTRERCFSSRFLRFATNSLNSPSITFFCFSISLKIVRINSISISKKKNYNRF